MLCNPDLAREALAAAFGGEARLQRDIAQSGRVEHRDGVRLAPAKS
jgi:hypothetical protein